MTASQLRSTRKRLGLSFAKLAEAIDYKDRVTLWKMETGRRPVSAKVELGLLRLEGKP